MKVYLSRWELEDDWLRFRVGDEVAFWLFFDEADRGPFPPERLEELSGRARLLPSWPGQEFGRYPVQVDAGPAALLWDSPDPVEGEVRLVGAVHRDTTDAPPDFPATCGVVRRVRMEWQEYEPMTSHNLTRTGRAKYEVVESSYFPVPVDDSPTARTWHWTGVLVDLDVTGTEPM